MSSDADIPPDPEQIFSQFGDLFGEFFGMSSGKKSADLRMSRELSLEQACEGAEVVVDVDRFIECARCDGLGAPESSRRPCATCEGKGRVVSKRGDTFSQSLCQPCAGRGFVADEGCDACAGLGRIGKSEKLTVKIPPGVRTGQQLRLAGKGNAASGAEPGHLYLSLAVRPDPRVAREGDDLFCIAPITPSIAKDGGDAQAPLPGGSTYPFTVPAGSKTGDLIRLVDCGACLMGSSTSPRPKQGRGSPYRRAGGNKRGDLIVALVCDGERVPTHLERRMAGELPTEEDKARTKAPRPSLWRRLFPFWVLLAAGSVGLLLAQLLT